LQLLYFYNIYDVCHLIVKAENALITENKDMAEKNAGAFWTRYKRLARKDLPVLIKTGILQPTLSSWRIKKSSPAPMKR
jgi:hypothetical protein